MDWPRSIRALLKGERFDSCIDAKERVVFFPTVACRISAGMWRIPVHGWIYQPTELSRIRRMGLHLVKRLLRLQVKRSDPQMKVFRERMGAMLADNERGERIRITLGETVFTLKRSRANGHFHGTLELPDQQVATLLTRPANNADWLTFRAVTQSNDPRIFDGRVMLLAPQGLSVISDIDDTIKISEVLDRRRLLHNTFVGEFSSVPGMAALYQRWQRECAASFHYVSASPWHLYPCLSEFLAGQEFPAGSFHMRTFRLAGRDLMTALRSPRRVKSLHIRHLLECYPHRRFLLVGDSGESDPDMYAHFARKHPTQIEKICVRNITEDPPDAPRWTKTFSGMPRDKWQIFNEPAELM